MPSPSPIKPILRQVLPHPLQTACWSPSGLMLAVGGSDGMVGVVLPEGGFVWKRDAVSWIEAVTLTVTSLAWSQDKNLLAVSFSVSLDILNSTDGKCISSYFYPENFKSLAWNRDSSSVLASNEDSYETFPAFCDDDEPFFYPNPITISAQGVILAARFDHDEKFCFITNSEKILSDYYGQNRAVSYHAGGKISLASFSPSGRFTLLYRDDAPSLVIDAENPAHETLFRPMSATPKCICVNEGGTHIACGLEDGGVLVQLVSGNEIRLQYTMSDGPVVWVGFAPTGLRLLVAHASGVLNIWDCAELGKDIPLPKNPALEDWLSRQCASVGLRLLGGRYRRTEFWVPHLASATGDDLLGMIQAQSGDATLCTVALNSDGSLLYLSNGNRLQAWDLKAGSILWEINFNLGELLDLALSPDGQYLALAKKGAFIHQIEIICASDPTEKKYLYGHQGNVQSVAFSPNGQQLISGGNDKTIRLWDLATSVQLACITTHTDWVMAVAYSTSGDVFASGSNDRTVRIWNAATLIELACYESQKSDVRSLTYSPVSDKLACGTIGGDVILWSANGLTHKILKHNLPVDGLAFSYDGSFLATGSFDHAIRIWNTKTGDEIHQFFFPEKYCWRLDWSANGAFLVAGIESGNCRIFATDAIVNSVPINVIPQTESTVSTQLASLPDLWMQLQQFGIAAPLALIQQVQDLLTIDTHASDGGNTGINGLQNHPGLLALRALHWPASAHIGLLALLLHNWPETSTWQPPNQHSTKFLRQALLDTLANNIEITAEPQPLAWLPAALAQVDERLRTLLQAIGHDAVATDPGLPLRLLPQVIHLPRFTPLQRRILCTRLPFADVGSAQSVSGGTDRAGIAGHGPLTALLPFQWLYPRKLLRRQLQNGGLLYRTRSAREAPVLRSVIIVLDTTPACFGPIEAITRPAAYAVAQNVVEQGQTAILLTTGDHHISSLANPAERLQLFTHRSLIPVDIAATLAHAIALRQSVRSGSVPPIILLLTHCWWGSEEERPQRIEGLRAMFVQYPLDSTSPPFGRCCELWERVHQPQAVAGVLGRLLA